MAVMFFVNEQQHGLPCMQEMSRSSVVPEQLCLNLLHRISRQGLTKTR